MKITSRYLSALHSSTRTGRPQWAHHWLLTEVESALLGPCFQSPMRNLSVDILKEAVSSYQSYQVFLFVVFISLDY